MNATELLQGLEGISWTSYPQPQWNRQDQVPAELQALVACDSEQAAQRSYNALLYALGNNHAGTYFPVILPALPFLGRILEHGNEFSRGAVLDIIIDLYCSFGPEAGFETVDLAGSRVDLKPLVDDELRKLSPLVMTVGQVQGASERLRALAEEFQGALDP